MCACRVRFSIRLPVPERAWLTRLLFLQIGLSFWYHLGHHGLLIATSVRVSHGSFSAPCYFRACASFHSWLPSLPDARTPFLSLSAPQREFIDGREARFDLLDAASSVIGCAWRLRVRRRRVALQRARGGVTLCCVCSLFACFTDWCWNSAALTEILIDCYSLFVFCFSVEKQRPTLHPLFDLGWNTGPSNMKRSRFLASSLSCSFYFF